METVAYSQVRIDNLEIGIARAKRAGNVEEAERLTQSLLKYCASKGQTPNIVRKSPVTAAECKEVKKQLKANGISIVK